MKPISQRGAGLARLPGIKRPQTEVAKALPSDTVLHCSAEGLACGELGGWR